MYYRRKVILALLQSFGGELPKINFYKLMMIFTKGQVRPEYDFVPYHYGCYSFSLHADLETMHKKGIVTYENKMLKCVDAKKYLPTLTDADKRLVVLTREQFINSTENMLMYFTYTKFPYTAINSLAAKNILSTHELAKVDECRLRTTQTVLYTIGYEGISLEEYLNRLIQNDVKVLVDVRNNPVSMKFGFSKNQLKGYCEKLGIEYMHIPQVGIQSAARQELKTQSDYDILFTSYLKKNLSKTGFYQKQIFDLLVINQRIALTCFEANICKCHRKHLADAITQQPGWNFEIKHI